MLAATPGSIEERQYRRRIRSKWGGAQARVLLRRRPGDIRVVLTALTTLRSFTLRPTLDLSSITLPFTGTDRFRWVEYVPKFWRTLKSLGQVPNPRKAIWRESHFTLRAGPNGPAL